MSKGINRWAISIGIIAATLIVLLGFVCLNTVIYAVMAPEPTAEIEAPFMDASLITRAN